MNKFVSKVRKVFQDVVIGIMRALLPLQFFDQFYTWWDHRILLDLQRIQIFFDTSCGVP